MTPGFQELTDGRTGCLDAIRQLPDHSGGVTAMNKRDGLVPAVVNDHHVQTQVSEGNSTDADPSSPSIVRLNSNANLEDVTDSEI
jgi:hypothetical protein